MPYRSSIANRIAFSPVPQNLANRQYNCTTTPSSPSHLYYTAQNTLLRVLRPPALLHQRPRCRRKRVVPPRPPATARASSSTTAATQPLSPDRVRTPSYAHYTMPCTQSLACAPRHHSGSATLRKKPEATARLPHLPGGRLPWSPASRPAPGSRANPAKDAQPTADVERSPPRNANPRQTPAPRGSGAPATCR